MGAGQELLILLILKNQVCILFSFLLSNVLCFLDLKKFSFFFFKTDPNKKNRVICEAECVQVRGSV